MRHPRFHTPILFSMMIAALGRGEAIAQQPGEPPGLLEVEQVAQYEVKLRLHPDREAHVVRGFNQGRPYAISINEHLPDARIARARMGRDLDDRKRSHMVVLDWFGSEPPKRLNLWIGSEIPVEIAQAAIAAYADGSKVPVYILLMDTDAGFNNTRRIYVGGLVDHAEGPMPPEKIRGLLKPGLGREELANLLSRRDRR